MGKYPTKAKVLYSCNTLEGITRVVCHFFPSCCPLGMIILMLQSSLNMTTIIICEFHTVLMVTPLLEEMIMPQIFHSLCMEDHESC